MSPLPCASARMRSCRRRGRHVRHAGKHAQLWSTAVAGRNPTGKARPSGLQHISHVQDSASDESNAGPPFCSPPFQSIGIQKQTHSVRSHSGPKGIHEASNKRCTQTFLPRCQSSVPKRHRESQEDCIPGQAANTSAPRWNLQLKNVGGTYLTPRMILSTTQERHPSLHCVRGISTLPAPHLLVEVDPVISLEIDGAPAGKTSQPRI